MPPTSIFISAASAGMSGMGYSRISVLLGPVRTAANTVSATFTSSPCLHGRTSSSHPRLSQVRYKDVDARDKPGHDGLGCMLGFIKKGPDQSAALDRLREWTRSRFALAAEDA